MNIKKLMIFGSLFLSVLSFGSDYSDYDFEDQVPTKKIDCAENPKKPPGSSWQSCTCKCNKDSKVCWVQIPAGTNPNVRNCNQIKQECTDKNGEPGYLVNCTTP